MKKLLFLISLLVLSVFVSACDTQHIEEVCSLTG